jgi:dienelactone hydrolase
MRGLRLVGAAVAAAAALLAAGCGSSATSPPIAAARPTTSSTPAYQMAGPDPVGVTTLDLGSAGTILGERLATVYYPANPAALSNLTQFSYTEASTLPASLQGILPPQFDSTTTINASRDAPGSPSGPYPVVLFSHGFGGERLYYSNLLAGIASWGYVVVSADYLERGLAAQALRLTVRPSATLDRSIMLDSLGAVERASGDPSSVIHGVVNPSKVAAVGHSAGGGTAFDALDSPQVATAVGWAPVPPTGTPSSKPVMLIGAEGDQAVLPSSVAKTYASFHGPKASVEISGEGHNTYTDICVGIRQGGGLINYAVSNHFTTPQLARLAINGCEAKDLPPQQFWPIVQYYTVFQIKAVLGHGSTTVPVPAAGAFPGFKVTIHQQG